MSSHELPSVHVCVLISSSNKGTSGLEPTHMISFNLHSLLKDCLQIQPPSEVLRPGTSTYEFGGQIMQPIALQDYKNHSKSFFKKKL